MSEKVVFTTGVGRLVQGSIFEPQTTDAEGKPLVVKSGPNAGAPRKDWFFAIAIDKNDPSCADMFAKMQEAAAAGFPRGESQSHKFAWKYIDGDGVDGNGQPYSARPGFAGCYVFKFGGGFQPKAYVREGGALREIVDQNAIKRGYYIQVNGTISGNGSAQQPGIYLNHSMVLLAGYGEEIVSGPDPEDAFGGAAPALPAGASATPPAGTMPGAPGAPGAGPAAGPGAPGAGPGAPGAGPGAPGAGPAPGAGAPGAGPAPGAPGAGPAAGPAPGAPGAPGAGSAPQGVSPAPDILDPNGAAPGAPGPAAPAAPVKRLHPNGQAYTEDQLRAGKWDEASIAALPVAQ